MPTQNSQKLELNLDVLFSPFVLILYPCLPSRSIRRHSAKDRLQPATSVFSLGRGPHLKVLASCLRAILGLKDGIRHGPWPRGPGGESYQKKHAIPMYIIYIGMFIYKYISLIAFLFVLFYIHLYSSIFYILYFIHQYA